MGRRRSSSYRHRVAVLSLLGALIAGLLFPEIAFAYTKETHASLADAIIDALEADGRVEQAAVVDKYKESLVDGLVAADEWIVATNGELDVKGAQYNTLQHFHDPWSHQGNGNLADLFSWEIPGGRTADEYYWMADSAFVEGVDELYPEGTWNADAFFKLGVGLHVLQDATVPMHTDDDVQQLWKYSHNFYENKVAERLGDYPIAVKPIYSVSVKSYHPDGVFSDRYHEDGVYEDSTPYVFVDYAAHQSRELYEDYKAILALPARGQAEFENGLVKEWAVSQCAKEMVPLSVSLSAGMVSRFLASHGIPEQVSPERLLAETSWSQGRIDVGNGYAVSLTSQPVGLLHQETINVFDTETGGLIDIHPLPAAGSYTGIAGAPRTGSGKVVWEEARPGAGATAPYSQLYLYDVGAETERQLSGSAQITSYDIREDLVVWASSVVPASEVHIYRLSSGEETVLPSGSYAAVSTDGRYVVWTDVRSGVVQMFAYDTQTTEVSSIAGSAGSFSVDDGVVVFSALGKDSSGASSQNIYSYDLTSGLSGVVCDAPGVQSSPQVSSGIAMWVDARSGTYSVRAQELTFGSEYDLGTEWLEGPFRFDYPFVLRQGPPSALPLYLVDITRVLPR